MNGQLDIEYSGGPSTATLVAPPPPVTVTTPPDTTPPDSPRAKRSRLRVIGAIGAVVVILLGIAGVVANLLLAQAYSPQRAVTDYFAAQQRGDVNVMWANATYQRGEGSFGQFFNRSALSAMMKIPQNRDLKGVRVTGIQPVNASTVSATVALTWDGAPRTLVFAVRKDPSNVHWLFYPSWRIEIPSSTVNLTFPGQPGQINVDGSPVPNSASWDTIPVIMGFHDISMDSTNLYERENQIASVVGSGDLTLKGTLSTSAIAAANTAVKQAIATCDAAKYRDCPGHTYTAPDRNYIYYLTLAGYGNVNYTSYVLNLTGDPTSGMKIAVSNDQNKVTVSGTCTSTLTVNGGATYNFKGDYSGTLTWNGTGFDWDVVSFCNRDKA